MDGIAAGFSGLKVLGIVIVAIISFVRYDQVPPPLNFWSKRASFAETLRLWLKAETPKHFVFPPPRANTTPFKYWMSRIGYALVGVGIYLAILEIPMLIGQVTAIVTAMPGVAEYNWDVEQFNALLTAGPVTAAFVIAVILPLLPGFKSADLYIRSQFYEYASIPAQRFREVWRLKEADYSADANVLNRVVTSLSAEGFRSEDLGYDPNTPSTKSLWMKASLLMRHCEIWAAEDRYKTAFGCLIDVDEHTLSFDKLMSRYNALKGDAKMCFQQLHQSPDAVSAEREDAFRQNCKTLLLHFYDFLSRVSLHSHYSEDERIHCMRDIGFHLRDKGAVPLPDANDLIMLVLVLAGVFIIPLSVFMEISKAAIIGAIVYSAILMPIYIAGRCPKLIARRTSHALPDLLFPLVSALCAMLFGFLVIMAYRYAVMGFDFSAAWDAYTKKYPWSFIHGTMAFMIALRMRIGRYPDPTQLQGWQRYRAWGSLRDGMIILAVAELVLSLLVFPQLLELGAAPSDPLRPLVILGMMSFTIGFIVPTWYRARRALRMTDRRASDMDRRKYEDEFRVQLGVG